MLEIGRVARVVAVAEVAVFIFYLNRNDRSVYRELQSGHQWQQRIEKRVGSFDIFRIHGANMHGMISQQPANRVNVCD